MLTVGSQNSSQEPDDLPTTMPSMAAGRRPDSSKIHVLLTVPHLVATASPYRETMAIAKYLPRDEFELTVCALRPAGVTEAAIKLAGFGAHTVVVPFRPTARTLRGAGSAIVEQWTLRQLGRVDLQHSLDFTSSPFEGACARLMGRRFVYTQRNLNEGGHEPLLKMKIGLSRGVVAISRVTEALVRQLGSARTKVWTIPLGFDFDEVSGPPRVRSADEPPVILAVGHLQRRKRIEDAMQALAIVRQAVPGAQLWVVGRTYDQAYKAELLALSDRLGLAGAVQFLGVREDVISLMQNAAALLHCAESEAFGWSVLEAMAAGLPVVAYDSGGPAELIQHGVTGFLAEIGDYTACSRHLTRLLTDTSLAQKMSCAASVQARTAYTARAFGEQHAVLYRRLTAPSPGATSSFAAPAKP